MPKKAKKGGGGGKGAGRTEEERLMLLQQRAQAEEETAKKKEEILTLFLKDKLQKEERNTAVNLLKLNEGWRSVLRHTRGGELRRDVAALSQTFERQLDGLDSVVKNLACDLQEAERQSAQLRRVHLRHAEHLRDLQDKRLGFLQQRWDAGLQQLGSRFSSETRRISLDSRQQRDGLEDATFTMEQQHQTEMAEIHRVYSESIAACDTAYEQRKTSLVMDLKERLQQDKLRTRDAVQRCRKETQQLLVLDQQTQRLVRAAEEDVRTVRRMQERVLTLRGRLASTRTDGASLEKDQTTARNQTSRRTHELRDQLLQAQAAARKQLSELTVRSAAAAKTLQAAIGKSQQVLRVADMCRRLDGEQREVSASLFPSEERGEETPGAETPGAEAERPMKEMSALQQVTRSINASVLLRAALRRRRDDLRRENQQLRLLLRQHQDAMTLGGGGDLDALLAVSGAPTTNVPPDPDRRHAVIEAVHAIKHS